jgi:hypothetical protein
MTIEAKPPVRSGSGGGMIVVAVLAAAVCVPLLIFAALTVSWFFARSSSEQVVYATPAYAVAEETYIQISPEFEARLNAANRIQVTSERDEALGVLAAIFSQSTDEANRAIQGIQDVGARDTAAWNAARRFSKGNSPQDAVKMIEMMLDQSSRDAGFRAVATGDWPERPVATPTVTAEAMVTEAVGYAAEAVADEVVVEAGEEVVVEEEVVEEAAN